MVLEMNTDNYLDPPKDKVALLHIAKEERDILRQRQEGRPTALVTSYVGTAFSNTLLKIRQKTK